MTSKIYAFDKTSTVLWTNDLDPGALTDGVPVYKDEKLYVETNNTSRNILAFDAASSKTLWKFNSTGTYTKPFSVTSDSLIVLDDTNIIGMTLASDKIILENYNKKRKNL